MHICIPDTREVRPPSGSAYLLYNVHIDGLYHCSLRYKQLHHLHQALTKRFPSGNFEGVTLPPFPPKKLLPLTQGQVEERRQLLEKYLQNISQDKQISSSPLFNMYLLEAQRESSARLVDANKHVHLDIELVNGQKIRLPIVSQDSVDSVLTACCRSLGLADQYNAYFCLCLCGYDVVSDKLIIKRRLSFFEAPFITLQMAIQQQEQLQSALTTAAGKQQQQHLGYHSNHGHYHNHQHPHQHSHTQQQQQHYSHKQYSQSSSPSPSATASSLNNNNNNNPDSSTFRCLSCSQQQQQQQAANLTTATRVPLVTSTSATTTTVNDLHRQQPHLRCGCPSNSTNGCQQVVVGPASLHSSRGSFVTHRILLRKSYWDPIYDSYILSDPQALSLLFIQTVYDMKHSLMFVERATYQRLESLLASDSKLDYILLARTLKYYNYVHFEPCYSDYPRPRTKVMISIGSKELNMRVLKQPPVTPSCSLPVHQSPVPASPPGTLDSPPSPPSPRHSKQNDPHDQQVLYCTSSLVPYRGHRQLVRREDLIEEEYNFKVPLIRCWRLTSLETLNSNGTQATQQQQRQAPSATTTLAGGKRRSLSLFSSVVGNSTGNQHESPRNSGHNRRDAPNTHATTATTTTTTGTGGSSLMASLISHTSDTNNSSVTHNGLANGHHNHCHQANGTTTTNPSTSGQLIAGAPSQSFHSFSSNANQTSSATSNSHLSNGHHNQHNQSPNQQHHEPELTQLSQYELSFEYLIAKDTLRWITISSDQAIFISISLQGVVDELVSKRELMGALGAADNAALLGQPSPSPPAVSRPIAIRGRPVSSSSRQQLAESFTYLYRDGGQKSIKAKSQQQLQDKFCMGAMGSALSASAPPSSSGFAGQGRQRAAVADQQVANFWSNSPPGRYYGHQSSSGAYARPAPANPAVAPFEFGHHYHCNTRRASGHSSKCKAPSPIINDAFEGVVSTDDDL